MKFVINNINGEQLICSELNVSFYKEILKSVYGDEPSAVCFAETVYEVLEKLTNKPKQYFQQLNVYELFQILVELRIQSFGNFCSLNVSTEQVKQSLELDLERVLVEVKEYLAAFENTCIEDGSLKLYLSLPKPQRLLEKIQDEYLYYMNAFSLEGVMVDIPDNNSARLLFDKLTPKIASRVICSFENLINVLTKQNLLKKYGIEEKNLVFVPSMESLIWFTKLIFNESIETFYNNMFVLSHHGHFNASYIESCTPGEYIFFIKKLIATLSEKEKSTRAETEEPAFQEPNLPVHSINQEFSDPNFSGEEF